MSERDTASGGGRSVGELDRLDVLMSRAVDGEATAGDWSELSTLAGTDGRVWRELAERQRDQAALSRAVQVALVAADRVDLQRVGAADAGRVPAIEVVRGRSRMISTWGGWAAAAAIVAAVALAPRVGFNAGTASRGATTPGPTNTASFADPSAALRAYLDKGQAAGTVVGEVPTRVLVDSKPIDGGGYEITYLRQIIERARVPELYQVGTDDLGRPVPVRAAVDPMVTDIPAGVRRVD